MQIVTSEWKLLYYYSPIDCGDFITVGSILSRLDSAIRLTNIGNRMTYFCTWEEILYYRRNRYIWFYDLSRNPNSFEYKPNLAIYYLNSGTTYDIEIIWGQKTKKFHFAII
jgi:hypothetical protein